MAYVAPAFRTNAFTCPSCNVYSTFGWSEGQRREIGTPRYTGTGLWTATCIHCRQKMIWLDHKGEQTPLWPIGLGNAPLPHEAMPEGIKADYIEARSIATLSPRGAAALLRLAIQKLCKHLGEPGKNIYDDIGSLVKRGLPVQIQQALDVVRITGNNAVHPGELRVEDDPEIVATLFGLVNLIVENRIAEPKRIQAMYDALPEGARKGIEVRDG